MRPLVAACALLLAACGGEAPEAPQTPQPETSSAAQPDPRAPVVVYASYEDGNYWPQFLQAFTEETGIRVNVRTREQPVNVEDVIANRGTPPADVLIVDGVHDLWRASDEGALRPLFIPAGIASNVDQRFRDPDGQWVAIAVRAATIVFDPETIEPSMISSYQDLGDEALHGKLCLSSSALPTNRALIAMLIDELGVRPAELAVRYWIRNLAVPPFASDDALLDALAAGTCRIGIVSSQAAEARDPEGQAAFASLLPNPTYVNIEGAAVVRHAHEPDKANRLIAWLLQGANLERHASATNSMTAGPVDMTPLEDGVPTSAESASVTGIAERGVSVAGWRDEEAILLAERAHYP